MPFVKDLAHGALQHLRRSETDVHVVGGQESDLKTLFLPLFRTDPAVPAYVRALVFATQDPYNRDFAGIREHTDPWRYSALLDALDMIAQGGYSETSPPAGLRVDGPVAESDGSDPEEEEIEQEFLHIFHTAVRVLRGVAAGLVAGQATAEFGVLHRQELTDALITHQIELLSAPRYAQFPLTFRKAEAPAARVPHAPSPVVPSRDELRKRCTMLTDADLLWHVLDWGLEEEFTRRGLIRVAWRMDQPS